jgi:hypothetical protein
LKEQLFGGWAQNVLVNKHEGVDQEFVEAQEDKLRKMIFGVSVMRVINGRVLATTHERERVLSDGWLQLEGQMARMKSAPGWALPGYKHEAQKVQGVFVSLGPQPDKLKFAAWMHEVLNSVTPLGRILRVVAFLHLDGTEPSSQAFEAVGRTTRWVSSKLQLGGMFQQPPHSDSKILVIGENLSPKLILEAATQTRKDLRVKTELKTVDSLEKCEVDMVNKTRQTEECPEGMYYTGSHWVNFYGEPVFEHPYLPQFLEEYVAKENTTAIAHNAEVDSEWEAATALAAQSFVLVDGERASRK